jgi:hypothetical protein
MSATSAMAQQEALPENLLQQFITVSTFLHLLDPVRGRPTIYDWDTHLEEHVPDRVQLQRFLDSFALIFSTSRKGGETASAVCLEQNETSGTTLRVARNLSVNQDVIVQAQQILEKLRKVSLQGMCAQSWL